MSNEDDIVNLEDMAKSLNILSYDIERVSKDSKYFIVHCSINLSSKKLTELPSCLSNVITIKGDLNCSNNELTSLKNIPNEIRGNLYCTNNKLTSLKYLPLNVDGKIYLENNHLTYNSVLETDYTSLCRNIINSDLGNERELRKIFDICKEKTNLENLNTTYNKKIDKKL